MPTVLVTPHEKELRLIREMWAPMFLEGECEAFAKALHRGLGWPIVGLMRDDRIVHVLVKRPDGAFHDARGIVQGAELGAPFGVRQVYDIRPFEENEMGSFGHERMIQKAMHVAMMLWPDLPWKPDGTLTQMFTFVDALEKLCQEYQCSLWSPSSETHPIIVSPAIGDEAGYTLKPLASGIGFALERRLR